MSNSRPTFRRTKRLAPCQGITLVQHNRLGSWDVFLSLFNSFVGLPPVDVVMLQDPPSRRGFLPSFAGSKSFCPPTPKPAGVFYVSLSFLSFYTVLPVGSASSADVFYLEVYTPTGGLAPAPPNLGLPMFTLTPAPGPPNRLTPPRHSPTLISPAWLPGTLTYTTTQLTP